MATSNVPNEVVNELFAQELDTPEGKAKIAALGGDWIRDRLREDSFARQILPPKKVKRSELQVSVVHDTLVKIVWLEPESRAMRMSFRSQPTIKYYRAARFEVPFHTIGSERYEKTEQELFAYDFPITEIIRKNVVRDIQEVEDFTFLDHAEAATQALQKEAKSVAFGTKFTDTTCLTAFNVNAGTAAEVGKVKSNDALFQTSAATAAAGVTETLATPVQKDDFIKLFKVFPGDGNTASRLRGERFLITDTDFEDIGAWTISEVGHQIAGETATSGWKSKVVVGRNYTRTIKTDILRPGNIYAFTAPKFLGGFLLMNKTKFYADKERNRVSFEAWEDIAIYFGNIAGVRKLELYAGSADDKAGATANTAILADRAPVAEKLLGRKNNLVDEGQTFPQVSNF